MVGLPFDFRVYIPHKQHQTTLFILSVNARSASLGNDKSQSQKLRLPIESKDSCYSALHHDPLFNHSHQSDTQTLHVCHICLDWAGFGGQCRHISIYMEYMGYAYCIKVLQCGCVFQLGRPFGPNGTDQSPSSFQAPVAWEVLPWCDVHVSYATRHHGRVRRHPSTPPATCHPAPPGAPTASRATRAAGASTKFG